jgi:hypothetical protein
MSEIEEPGFITIAANGMQPESESSSAYNVSSRQWDLKTMSSHEIGRRECNRHAPAEDS